MEKSQNKTYEISFLARGEEAAGAMISHLDKAGAEILSEEKIDPINLAYLINKHATAHFGCVHFSLAPEGIDRLQETLKFEDGILRYLIVTPPFTKEGPSQPRKGEVPARAESGLEEMPLQAVGVSNKDLAEKLEEISESLPQGDA